MENNNLYMNNSKSNTNKGLKALIHFSRIFVGAIFIFSGFVKAVDPLGYKYKIIDYFIAFGFDFFIPLALPLAFFFSGVEFLIGLALVINVKHKFNAWIAFLFMSFFTVLTLYLAINNPVSDCGCFGDAIILTNWETFWKNVVIMVFTSVLFFLKGKINGIFKKSTDNILMIVITIAVLGFEYYNLQKLPIMDFRPYAVGVNIPAAMSMPEGAKFELDKNNSTITKTPETSKIKAEIDANELKFKFPVNAKFIINITTNGETQTIETPKKKSFKLAFDKIKAEKSSIDVQVKPDKYVYEYTMENLKSGEKKTINSDDYIKTEIWKDTTWLIKETSDPILSEKGFSPSIHDLDIISNAPKEETGFPQGQNILDFILEDENYSFLMIAYDLEHANQEALKEANKIADFCKENGYRFYCLTSSIEEVIQKTRNTIKPTYSFFNGDEITLKTIVRSNPGYVLLKNGTILNKWHHTTVPSVENLSQVMKESLENVKKMNTEEE